MPTRIDILDWYQLDFNITTPKVTLRDIAKLIKILKAKHLISKWFYLFEGNTIRVRFRSVKKSELETSIDDTAKDLGLTISTGYSFEQYWETIDAFANSKVAETFADIMSSLTELTITRIDKPGEFSNYDLVERLSHCLFNNVYGSNTEVYFILKRLGVDFQLNDNPEQTVLDEEQRYQLTDPASIGMGSINVPIKIEKETK